MIKLDYALFLWKLVLLNVFQPIIPTPKFYIQGAPIILGIFHLGFGYVFNSSIQV